MALPKVYAFCNQGFGTDMQTWYAMHEDGTVLGCHLSSTRAWGIHDVQPPFKKEQYAEKLGVEDPQRDEHYELVICDERTLPPDEVMARNKVIGEKAEEQAEADV